MCVPSGRGMGFIRCIIGGSAKRFLNDADMLHHLLKLFRFHGKSAVRPTVGTPQSQVFYEKVLGRSALQDIARGTPLDWGMFR